MPDRLLLRECSLANGLLVTVHDVSSHYYGGYWQVALEIRCLVPLDPDMFHDCSSAEDARRLLGEVVPFVRRMERMAVHGDALESARTGLLERFEQHLLPFLGADHFPARFILAEYQQHMKKSCRGIPCLL